MLTWLEKPWPRANQSQKAVEEECERGTLQLCHKHFPTLRGKKFRHPGAAIRFRSRKSWYAYNKAELEYLRPYHEVSSVERYLKWLNERHAALELLHRMVKQSTPDLDTSPCRDTCTILRFAHECADKFGIPRDPVDLTDDVPAKTAMAMLDKLRVATLAHERTPPTTPTASHNIEGQILLTPTLAAERAKCDKSTMTKYMNKGKVEVRLVKTKRMVVQASLDRAIAEEKVKPKKQEPTSTPLISKWGSEKARKAAEKYDL